MPYPWNSGDVLTANDLNAGIGARAKKIGYAEKFGSPILSNVIAIQDIPGLSMTVTVDTSKIYLFVLEGFGINSTSGNVWSNIYVRDSGVSLAQKKTFVTTAYGNTMTLVAPHQFTVGGGHAIVASINRDGGGGQLDIYGTSLPWTLSMYDMGDM